MTSNNFDNNSLNENIDKIISKNDDIIKENIEALYKNCINCKNKSIDCPGILKDKKNGVIPRGFFYSSVRPRIMIVGKNPGHPLETEIEKYQHKSDLQILENHKKLVKELFNESKLKTTFHKNLDSYVRLFLELPKDKNVDIFDHVCYTNLVKCSTDKESGRISSTTIKNCFVNYFKTEIELFKPKVILALGREVDNYLKKNLDFEKLDINLIYVKHPSYYYKKEERSEILEGIKSKILK